MVIKAALINMLNCLRNHSLELVIPDVHMVTLIIILLPQLVTEIWLISEW